MCYLAKTLNKANDVAFKWDSHISTASHLEDSSIQKALRMTSSYE